LITFEPYEIANNLQKNGAFIPGLKPGKETGDYLKKVVYRTTFAGGLFLAFVAVIPFILQAITNISFLTIGGTSVLIVVSVVIETLKTIEGELEIREYSV
jgi:preprotein translocase subunit SecY